MKNCTILLFHLLFSWILVSC